MGEKLKEAGFGAGVCGRKECFRKIKERTRKKTLRVP